ncbi:hypothetical protein HF329_13125 [Chitinophaga oryzae]|uniref:Uncharacterized protein n=1 Tax=Chitinophaga oryzae TaxID=2725414 RepID=A0AAE6ZGD6_9BACT|nr:hypothetical protein [Chitinophaga oryzae]QJB32216.1 hypothetical protein HF329_13125 [Chitinophaga oryzae]
MQDIIRIPTFVLIDGNDADGRGQNALAEFSGREEFDVTPVVWHDGLSTLEDKRRATVAIIATISDSDPGFVLICDDSHRFTPAYTAAGLLASIRAAQEAGADVLTGGANSFVNAIRIAEYLYWVERFKGFQFTVYFRKLFGVIVNADTDRKDEVKFLMHPFISVQQGQDSAFRHSEEKLTSLSRLKEHFQTTSSVSDITAGDYEGVSIPTYVINLPERHERRQHILQQFAGRDEFDLTIVPACSHQIGAVGLWQSIRKILEIALDNDEDDVIIICEDDHEFTDNYSKEKLFRNILEARRQGANLLIGGIGNFKQVIPVTNERCWIDVFWATQFLVIFRDDFRYILDQQFDDTVTADDFLSEILTHKMVFFPFISVQKDFGYSDISQRTVVREVPDTFEKCEIRIKKSLHIHHQQDFVFPL